VHLYLLMRPYQGIKDGWVDGDDGRTAAVPIAHPVDESITTHHTHAVLKLPRGEAPDYQSQISLPIMSRLGNGVYAGTSQAAPIAYYPAST
jgi:hypothetical protein